VKVPPVPCTSIVLSGVRGVPAGALGLPEVPDGAGRLVRGAVGPLLGKSGLAVRAAVALLGCPDVTDAQAAVPSRLAASAAASAIGRDRRPVLLRIASA